MRIRPASFQGTSEPRSTPFLRPLSDEPRRVGSISVAGARSVYGSRAALGFLRDLDTCESIMLVVLRPARRQAARVARGAVATIP